MKVIPLFFLKCVYLSLLYSSLVFIEIILNNNSFQFNNVNYIQTLGTAMGTKMAPTYATLTQAYAEENLYEILGKNTAMT